MDKYYLFDFFIAYSGLIGIDFTLKYKRKKERREKTKYKLQQIKRKLILEDDIMVPNYFTRIQYAVLNEKDKQTILEITKELQKNKNLYNFYQKLRKEVKQDDLINFFINIPSVHIKKEKFNFKKFYAELLEGQTIQGKYRPLENCITLYTPHDKSTLNHELIHLASYNPITMRIGFLYDEKGTDDFIGYGINEGCTELFNKRFFDSKSKKVYTELIKIAELIELFYPNKEEFKSDFFHANFYNLFITLTQSLSYNEAMSLLIDIDYLHDNSDDKKYFKNLKNNMYELYRKNHSDEENKKFKIKAKIK